MVPRSFFGPLALSALSWPLVRVGDYLGATKLESQYVGKLVTTGHFLLITTHFRVIVRATLALLVLSGLANFHSSLLHKFGPGVTIWHALLTASQFHLCFYISRTLPNVFALIMVLHALAFWLRGKDFSFLFSSAAAVVIFRGELAMLLGSLVLMELLVGKRTWGKV